MSKAWTWLRETKQSPSMLITGDAQQQWGTV